MYYFASDVHLGHGDTAFSRERERLFVRWLDEVSADADAIYLLGDIFDFWFEWGRVVPAGFVRLLGKLAELTDRGIEIHFFTGNHDMWQNGYLERECGVHLHFAPERVELAGRRMLLAHGDNINVGDKRVLRFMNGVFRSRIIRWLFARLVHPDLSMRFGLWWSGSSRKSHGIKQPFAVAAEPLVRYAEEYPESEGIDTFVFGHIHCAEHHAGSRADVWFLGEWLADPVYGVLDGEGRFSLRKYK